MTLFLRVILILYVNHFSDALCAIRLLLMFSICWVIDNFKEVEDNIYSGSINDHLVLAML